MDYQKKLNLMKKQNLMKKNNRIKKLAEKVRQVRSNKVGEQECHVGQDMHVRRRGS